MEVIDSAEHDAVVTLGGNESSSSESGVVLRKPTLEDGLGISALVRGTPPLDPNSSYCHLIQSSHFAGTCVVAERSGVVVGWISAHRPPSAPDQIFVWQIAVDPSVRGVGLALRMLDALVARPAVRDVPTLTATVTASNSPSWALFNAFARKSNSVLTRKPLFECEKHFGGAQETEWLVTISLPLSS